MLRVKETLKIRTTQEGLNVKRLEEGRLPTGLVAVPQEVEASSTEGGEADRGTAEAAASRRE